MTGKKLTRNLQAYLEPLFDVPVYTFDQNEKRELPCVIVGYDQEEQSAVGLFGHYTVSGFAIAAVQGYEDADNTEGDLMAEELIEVLADQSAIGSSLNAPLTGTDVRPLSGFHLHRLLVRGTKREEQEKSSFVFVNFDAFTMNKDG